MNQTIQTKQITVSGVVQGVGFRPYVCNLARSLGLTGTVANFGSCVKIIVQGTKENVERFVDTLKSKPPKRARILRISVTEKTDRYYLDFTIIESKKETGERFVSPDIGICENCRQELFDPENIRYMHPFINCTDCGPRLTILEELPYDRERTCMSVFPMCEQCRREYESPRSRRYDAQPVCCNTCGPEVYLINQDLKGSAAIRKARQAIADGKIIAVKGIGGFHLCCDAENEAAVQELRRHKRRPEKPFAVMMRDLETVEEECIVTEDQKTLLLGPESPILLLKNRKNHVAPSVTRDNPNIGVMLPYAPIHLLLFSYDDEVNLQTKALVMTSGNQSGSPICKTDKEAAEDLGYCALILSHNREIRIQADDSVMNVFEGNPYMIRRSRGYAPLPVNVPATGELPDQGILAVGGELKNTFCLSMGEWFYLSPYIGNISSVKSMQVWKDSVEHMEKLLQITPALVVCDLHPQYHTTRLAEETHLPVIQVQHHFAHIASCMAENQYTDPVIGVAFDGTGYGSDGTIWGGELLKADLTSFERMGYIRPFVQVGGDQSAKEGWRIAVAMIQEWYPKQAEEMVRNLKLCEESVHSVCIRMQQMGLNCIRSTSAGRLFDAVSAILGIRLCSTFEGESANALQFAAERYAERHTKAERVGILQEALRQIGAEGTQDEQGLFVLETEKLVRYVIESHLAEHGQEEKLAYVFHGILAKQLVKACDALRRKTGLSVCALSGGVFQNQLFLKLCKEDLEQQGFRVLIHSTVPPNDGGIALGQAAVCRAQIKRMQYED